MKYILMMNNMSREDKYAGVTGWRNEDIQAHMVYMRGVTKWLRESGELVFTEGLALPDEAVNVRAGNDGAPITDGVFPEGKEFLAGFWIVQVESRERACQIAARASAAPGPGGLPLNMSLEVRQLVSRSPDESL